MADLDAAEDAAKELLGIMEAFPRFRERAVDPLHPEGERGALVFRGPLKLVQTVSKLTCASKASTVGDRFKALLSRSKWVRQEEIKQALDGADGLDGLDGRLAAYDPTREYVAVVVAELQRGPACWHQVGGGHPASIEDSGPWLYVLDHGTSRAGRRPGFSYTGSLRPYRVSPRRPVAEGILLPDYATDGDPRAEQAAPARSTPPVVNAAQAEKLRAVCRMGREIVDAAHRVIKPGVTTDEIDRVVHDKHMEFGAYPAPLNYHNFPKSVCTSVNEVVCHGVADSTQ